MSAQATKSHLLLVHGARQVVQVTAGKEKVLAGSKAKSVKVLQSKPDDGLSIVVDGSGRIVAVGYDSEIKAQFKGTSFDRRLDARDSCILPGFIDAHSHPIWTGDRVHEFRMKLAGASYMGIHNAGGGIHYTVEHTRRASEEELFRSLRDRLLRMFRSGTTTVECKTGYGLTTESELKLLRVLERAKRELTFIDISITYCGAHAIPKEMSEDAYTRNIIEEQLPAIAKGIRYGDITVDSIDVFCDRGMFEVDNSRKILQAGRELGLRLNFHSDELAAIGGAEMGAQMKAEAISHLERVTDVAIADMAKNGCVGVILPTTAYVLRLESPPVRKLIDAGVPLALGSDFNPNAFCLAMPMVMHLACILCRMSLEEALVGSTLNAAAALGISETHGSIEVGKKADMILVDIPTWEHIIYQFGEYDHLIQVVIKNGRVAFDKAEATRDDLD